MPGVGYAPAMALICLVCRSANLIRDDHSARCSACHHTFPILRDIVDVRDAKRDLSVGYDFERDNALAARIGEVFDELSTFHEVRLLHNGLRDRLAAGTALDDLDPRDVIREDRIAPQPYSEADAAHGRSILDKVPLYVEGTDLPRLPTGTALEDGAGEGYHIVGLSERFEHVFVVDLSMCYMLLARKIVEERRLGNVTLICGSVEHLPLADDSMDFVHSNNVIEHVARQDLLFAEARRVLSPRGLLFVMSPNRFSLYFEPHFRLPGFGFIPRPISRRIIRRLQNRDISDIALRSLGEFRRLARDHFGSRTELSFIPRRLSETATGGRLRRALTAALNWPVVGGLTHFVVNRLALGVMPYHVLVGSKQPATAHADQS